MDRLLEVKDLHVSFSTHVGIVQAVRGIDFHLDKGETLAIVGESGSGKSAAAKALIGLNKLEKGEIKLLEKELTNYSEKDWQQIRGKEIAMIFQDPMTALNPTMTIGKQIIEGLRLHQKMGRLQAKDEALKLLQLVGITDGPSRLKQYPHQFSGGMRQRVVIAMALACNPKILIADEPTTALDVTIQSQILEVLKGIQKSRKLGIIFITHDLGVVANVADWVAVMYAGKIVETGRVEEIFYNPQHPYTWGLLRSMPSLDSQDKELVAIPGSPPNLVTPPTGDAFASRNPYALEIDFLEAPPMFQVSPTHYAATWLLHPNAPKVKKGGVRIVK